MPSPPTWSLFAPTIAHRLTEAWALTFVRAPTYAPQQQADLGPEPVTGRFWIWSGEQLSDLTSLEEAQWDGRFAAR